MPESPPANLPSPLNDPASPARRFLEAAAANPAPLPADYSPPDSVRRLAEVIFTNQATSFIELAEAAGVNRSTIWRQLQDKNAVKWIVEQGSAVAAAGLGAVHARLLHLALTSRSPSAIEIYLKRFDPDYRKESHGPGGTSINAQFAQVLTMSPTELEAFVKHKKRQGGFGDDSGQSQKAD
jgi:hypothetical protein